MGTPDEIYRDPVNAFVASFIGAPPMNLISGEAVGGVIAAPGITVPCPAGITGPTTLGVRPEDCLIGGAHLTGQVYGVEPTGDTTYLTVAAGGRQVEVKAPRDFRAPLDAPVSLGFDPRRLHFFDAGTGERIRVS